MFEMACVKLSFSLCMRFHDRADTYVCLHTVHMQSAMRVAPFETTGVRCRPAKCCTVYAPRRSVFLSPSASAVVITAQ